MHVPKLSLITFAAVAALAGIVGAQSATTLNLTFAASSDHALTFPDGTPKLDSYEMEVVRSGTATPVATLPFGKPTPDASNQIQMDVTSFMAPIAPGTYVAYVTATGPGGTSRSNPSNEFTIQAGYTPPTAPTSIRVTWGQTSQSDVEVVLYASDIAGIFGDWELKPDPSAANGIAACERDTGRAKLVVVQASPAEYFDLQFTARQALPYHVWFRMKAERNSYSNDSAYLQFSGALSAGGSALARIGTTSGLNITLEEGSGAGESGWGWNDDSYGGLGTNFYFSSDGAQTLRVQRREDGICIDQIIISSSRYLTARPGLTKDDTTVISR